MRMLSIMARSKKKGFLLDGESKMESKTLAKLTGESVPLIETLLAELQSHSVYSQTDDGVIFNRRMARESEISDIRAEAGRLGGRPKSKPKAKDKSKTKAPSASASEYASASAFEEWWSRYPSKVAKKVAAKEYAVVIKAGTAPEDLLRAVQGYRVHLKKNGTEERYCLHPSTFLHEDRWRDYLDAPIAPVEVGGHVGKDHDADYWARVRAKHAEGKRGDDHD